MPTAIESPLTRICWMLVPSLSTRTTGVQSDAAGSVTVVIGPGSQPAGHASMISGPPPCSARTNSSTVRCGADRNTEKLLHSACA